MENNGFPVILTRKEHFEHGCIVPDTTPGSHRAAHSPGLLAKLDHTLFFWAKTANILLIHDIWC